MTPIHPNRTQSSVLAAPARRRSTPLGGTLAILTVQRFATDDIGCDLLTGPDAGSRSVCLRRWAPPQDVLAHLGTGGTACRRCPRPPSSGPASVQAAARSGPGGHR